MNTYPKGARRYKKKRYADNPQTLYLCAVYKLLLSGLVLLFMGAGAVAQEVNPFELRHRLPKGALSPAPGSAVTALNNPFDVVPHRQPGTSSRLSSASSDIFQPLKGISRGNTVGKTFLFVVLFFVLTFVAFSVAFNRKALARAWNSFLNDNALGIAQREATGLVGNTPYYLLYTGFVLNAGMFMFLISRYFWRETFSNLVFFLLCIAASVLLFTAKHAALRVIGSLLPVGETIYRYNFLIVVFNCILGMFLLPFNFLIAFSTAAEGFMVFWALGLIILFYAYRAARAATIGARFASTHMFHFFLYLCTVEIAPILLLLKIAMNQGNS